MKNFILLLCFIASILFISCEKDTVHPKVDEISSEKSELLGLQQESRWEKLKRITDNKLVRYDDLSTKESEKFISKFGILEKDKELGFTHINNSIYLITPIRKNKKIKSLLVSFAIEGDEEYRTFVLDKKYLKSNEMTISGELYDFFDQILEYVTNKNNNRTYYWWELVNDILGGGYSSGCYEVSGTIATENCNCLPITHINSVPCSNFNTNDPYGNSNYPAFILGDNINNPYDYGGGPSNSGPGGGTNGGSIDAREMAMALNLAGQTFISHNGLSTLSSEQLFAIIGFDGYSYQFLYGFIDAEVKNSNYVWEKLVDYYNEQFDQTPSLNSFQYHDEAYLNLIKEASIALRKAGVVWFADFIDELVNSNSFQTVGDLYDTWYLVKDFISEYNNFQICQREQRVAQWMLEIFSPGNVGTILLFAELAPNFSSGYRATFNYVAAKTGKKLCFNTSKGYNSFNAFKNTHGPAGSNKAWHHIIEQNQITKSGFNPKTVHHPSNLVKIESGFSGSWHSRITAQYAKKGVYPETAGKSLRDWLIGKPFQTQYEWGLRVMRDMKP